MLDPLVDQGKDHGVHHGLGLEASTGREADEHPGGEDIEEDRGSQNVGPHFM